MPDVGFVVLWISYIVLCFLLKVEQKKKTKFVTADELLSTSVGQRRMGEGDSDLAKVKVIDMTGKEQRVLSGEILFIFTLAFAPGFARAWTASAEVIV